MTFLNRQKTSLRLLPFSSVQILYSNYHLSLPENDRKRNSLRTGNQICKLTEIKQRERESLANALNDF